MKVLITGSNGFIGENLKVHLQERTNIKIMSFTRSNSFLELKEMIGQADFIFHLAGVNRSGKVDDFWTTNKVLTQEICDAVAESGKKTPILYSSSTQAGTDTPYGRTKNQAEEILANFASENDSQIYIYRLPNVFGKWSKPNYNSAVATFCYNIARGLPIQINDPAAVVNLVYIDDVVRAFINVFDGRVQYEKSNLFFSLNPIYVTTVGELAAQIMAFRESRNSLITEAVGTGFTRALYSTYVSYLPTEKFSYELKKHSDPRGIFVEILKTQDAGQFSFFTAHPGITRGGHYHHSKTEKFLVIKGKALFRFRHMLSGDYYDLHTCGDKPEIVETVPGWTHDITNIGKEEMMVILWANEMFDRDFPDTYASEL